MRWDDIRKYWNILKIINFFKVKFNFLLKIQNSLRIELLRVISICLIFDFDLVLTIIIVKVELGEE
jgi:hypothetical protein